MPAAIDVFAKTGPDVNGDQALAVLQGRKADGPRGPTTIDPAELDIVHDICIRRVQKIGNALGNVPIEQGQGPLEGSQQGCEVGRQNSASMSGMSGCAGLRCRTRVDPQVTGGWAALPRR